MPANDDQIFRARERAQIARDAKRFSGFRIHVQARRAAVSLRDHGPLEGILLGINIFGVLRAEGQNHALPEIRQEQPLQDCVHGASLSVKVPIVKWGGLASGERPVKDNDIENRNRVHTFLFTTSSTLLFVNKIFNSGYHFLML